MNLLLLIRYVLVFFVLLFGSTSARSQHLGDNWLEIKFDSTFTFSLPTGYLILDTLHVKMASFEVDSLLGMQAHFMDSAYLNPSDELLNVAYAKHPNDTLRAIADLILFASNSELTAISDTMVQSKPGLEVGIRYLTMTTDEPLHSFVLFFYEHGKFWSFTITGAESDLPRFLEYKNAFFGSVAHIAQP